MDLYKVDFYQRLRDRIPDIQADADRLAAELAIPEQRRGSIGVSGADSGARADCATKWSRRSSMSRRAPCRWCASATSCAG